MASGTLSTPRPDWYPDPTNPVIERWWNGRAWSHQTRATADGGRVGRDEGAAVSRPATSDTAPVETTWHVPDTLEGVWDSFDHALLTAPYGMTYPKPLEVAVQ
jgi:hypothetical protein